jgi:hypothetical protein
MRNSYCTRAAALLSLASILTLLTTIQVVSC